ncbi:MAG: AAA family ATPase [Candidatus Margulisiibacteriota bacterium]|jgi:chromosome segregation protein
MYLKRVDIQGFKTFADRTVIDFMSGANITAVVGPNGCGKSNFLEAIRWGMGEQSVKVMRSSNSADVIFNGSENRKQVSMAEVEITIDNSRRVLATDFSEVTIRRKLYRSGESEYFLNKTLCRLKDIHDLFMDTGVGKNSYSIIGQGQIDILINMKPDEKKMMFEEAAGINKYKLRKRHAHRKLELTTLNLNRINDLQSEITTQVASLEKQAKEAETYLKYKEELKTLEMSSFKGKILLLNKQKVEVNQKIEELKKEILKISDQTNSNDEIRAKHRQKIYTLENTILDIQKHREEVNKEIETINTALLVNAERIQNQQQRLEQIAGDLGSIEATLQLMEKQKAETDAELLSNTAELKQINKDLSAKEKSLSTHKASLFINQRDKGEKQEKLNSDRSRLNLLEEMQRNYEGYFQGVKAVLEARDGDDRFKGIMGVVADIIETEKKYD